MSSRYNGHAMWDPTTITYEVGGESPPPDDRKKVDPKTPKSTQPQQLGNGGYQNSVLRRRKQNAQSAGDVSK